MPQPDRGPLAQPVGFGLAGRGALTDAIRWAQAAERLGIESVWVHDSYYERDAVTFTAAMASHVSGLRFGLGALNPYTRHPALVAQTVSALDDLAPGRISLGLGTGLPLRLGQMGIPYTPQAGVERVEAAIRDIRALWRGERIAAPNGLPPIQPMFPPVHHVPIYIAGYRTPMVQLAGRVADGYLARPAESLPGLLRLLERLRAASVAAGRDADAVHVAGYLLTHVDRSRREALNRAKREPFVIYMLAVQSDIAFTRAGFDPALRARIFETWRAEDYHRAAEMIPDELVDAFLVCGDRDSVADHAWRYRQAGMHLPILQPIVQEEEQVQAVLDAAVEYARRSGRSAATAASRPAAAVLVGGGDAEPEPARVGAVLGADEQLGVPDRAARRLGAWVEIARPFSLTAAVMPVATGGALAALHDSFNWPLFLLALLAGVCLQLGTNIINEIYDVRKGIDSITSPRASLAVLKGRVREREAFALAYAAFAVAFLLGVALVLVRGWPIVVLGLLGLILGWGYTAPPLQYKYRALGLPLVFVLMGPLMVLGAFYAVAGYFTPDALVASVPVGLLVTAILHGNEWRDIGDDARAGIRTFSIVAGRGTAHLGYLGLVVGAYMALGLAVALGALPPLSLLPVLSLPLLVRAIRASELGASGQQRAIAMIDLRTAELHASFGALLALGLFIAAVAH